MGGKSGKSSLKSIGILLSTRRVLADATESRIYLTEKDKTTTGPNQKTHLEQPSTLTDS
jgi:hypothetical protein